MESKQTDIVIRFNNELPLNCSNSITNTLQIVKLLSPIQNEIIINIIVLILVVHLLIT